LHNLDRPQEALKCVEEAIRLNPELTEAQAAKKLILGKTSHAYYENAVGLNSKDTLAWNNKGLVLLNRGKYLESLACWDKAIEIDPKNPAVWVNKGVALTYLGKGEEAIFCCDKALELDSENAGLWYNKGSALFVFGRYAEALKCVEEAIRLDPKSDMFYKLKQLILQKSGR